MDKCDLIPLSPKRDLNGRIYKLELSYVNNKQVSFCEIVKNSEKTLILIARHYFKELNAIAETAAIREFMTKNFDDPSVILK
jgi:hypothetical protein